jgi:hypothetical protein
LVQCGATDAAKLRNRERVLVAAEMLGGFCQGNGWLLGGGKQPYAAMHSSCERLKTGALLLSPRALPERDI